MSFFHFTPSKVESAFVLRKWPLIDLGKRGSLSSQLTRSLAGRDAAKSCKSIMFSSLPRSLIIQTLTRSRLYLLEYVLYPDLLHVLAHGSRNFDGRHVFSSCLACNRKHDSPAFIHP